MELENRRRKADDDQDKHTEALQVERLKVEIEKE